VLTHAHTHTHTHIHTQYTHIHTCTHMHVYTLAHMYTHIHTYAHRPCTYTHSHTCIHTCTHVYTHARTHICAQALQNLSESVARLDPSAGVRFAAVDGLGKIVLSNIRTPKVLMDLSPDADKKVRMDVCLYECVNVCVSVCSTLPGLTQVCAVQHPHTQSAHGSEPRCRQEGAHGCMYV
jgi:hypothetical protein